MGMFDTVHLSEPLKIPGCKERVTEIQTKIFGNYLMEYSMGSVLEESPVLIGVVEERVWCDSDEGSGEHRFHPVYFAIWHRILAGVFLDPEAAEARLGTVDRLDLITWLDQAQRRARTWKERYAELYSDVTKWHRHLNEPEKTDTQFESILWGLSEEILAAPDPLAAILEEHRHKGQTT